MENFFFFFDESFNYSILEIFNEWIFFFFFFIRKEEWIQFEIRRIIYERRKFLFFSFFFFG